MLGDSTTDELSHIVEFELPADNPELIRPVYTRINQNSEQKKVIKCFELLADKTYIIPENRWIILKPGIRIWLANNYACYIKPKRVLSLAYGIITQADLIVGSDANDFDEIVVAVHNITHEPVIIEKGLSIAELYIIEAKKIETNQFEVYLA